MQYNLILSSLLFLAGVALTSSEPAENETTKENLLENIQQSRKIGIIEPKIIKENQIDGSEDVSETFEGGRQKIKIKKKHKKFLMEALMGGLLIKSALLPLAVGFLKLLTGKALLMTLLALGLAMALTFKSATEKTVTTEVINLVPHHQRHRRSLPDAIQLQLETVLNPKKYQE